MTERDFEKRRIFTERESDPVLTIAGWAFLVLFLAILVVVLITGGK